ncbi:hypothetical protein BMS3Abin04_01316 [bacterium BMS3Abin04]|nr:hypothetical protein BMS3Abin04_01316 [bacterium BMS3Abin04]
MYNQNISSVFLSLEVPEYDLYKLLKPFFIRIDDSKLKSGNHKYLSLNELEQIKLLQFDSGKLEVKCASGLNINEVIGMIKRFAKLDTEVAFIDFLQRIRTDIKNRINELKVISQL